MKSTFLRLWREKKRMFDEYVILILFASPVIIGMPFLEVDGIYVSLFLAFIILPFNVIYAHVFKLN